MKRIFTFFVVAVMLTGTLQGLAFFDDAMLDVTDIPYSAAGDGISDDTAAVNAAIAACVIAGGGSVYLPVGNYLITSAITVPASVSLVFDAGAMLVIAPGVAVTMYGEINAPLCQIFAGDGTVAGEPLNDKGYPQWFGAKGDGVADDTAAFQKAISLLGEVEVYETPFSYLLGNLSITRSVVLRGCGNARLSASTQCANMFSITGADVVIENFDIDMSSAVNGSSVFYFPISRDKVRIRNIRTDNAYHVIKDADQPGQLVYNIQLTDFYCKNNRGTAFDMMRFYGFVFLTDIVIDNSMQQNVNYPAIKIYNNAGMELNNVRVIGGNGGPEEHGFDINLSWAVWFRGCSVENSGGFGFYSTNISYYNYYEDTLALDCKRGGYYLDDSLLTNGTLMKSIQTSPGVSDISEGIVIKDTYYALFTDVYMEGHSGNGLTVKDSSLNTFNNIACFDNGEYGVIEEGAVSQNLYYGLILDGNVSDILLIGENSMASNSVGKDKVINPTIPPPLPPDSYDEYTVEDGKATLVSLSYMDEMDENGNVVNRVVPSAAAFVKAMNDVNVNTIIINAKTGAANATFTLPEALVLELMHAGKNVMFCADGMSAELSGDTLHEYFKDGQKQMTVLLAAVEADELSKLQAVQAEGCDLIARAEIFSENERMTVPVIINFPYTLKDGEEPGGVCVWYLSDDGMLTRLDGTYDGLSGMVTFTANYQNLFIVGYDPVALWVNTFSDLSGSEWYYDAIAYVSYHGIVEGSDGKFDPNGQMTRAMFVMLLWNLEDRPEPVGTVSFVDVPDGIWYAKAIQWAAENGMVIGIGNGKFAPESVVNRAEMAALLYNYSIYKGWGIPDYRQMLEFVDSTQIAQWAQSAIKALCEAGVLNGNDGAFNPAGTATRADAAQIFMNFMRLVIGLR